MDFNCSAGNPQRNLYIDHAVAGKPDRVVPIALPDFAGEKTLFVHEHGDSICLYSGEAMHIYAPDLTSHKLIGALPAGPAVLLLKDGAWATHDGPVRKYDAAFNPIVEDTVVPRGGAWTTCLGVFPVGASVALAYAFSGGARQWAPELLLNVVKERPPAPPDPDAEPDPDNEIPLPGLEVVSRSARPGYVNSMVQLGGLLYAAGDGGLTILLPDGTVRKEINLPRGLWNLSACAETGSVGGFAQDADERWIYREYEAGGTEILDYTLTGAQAQGQAVFGPDGSRYLMSEKRLVKLGPRGDRIWSQALQTEHEKAPSFLVYRNGCAFVDGGALVLLDERGTILFRVPLPRQRISSPPYLDASGRFWLGLSHAEEAILRVEFKV
ncbi:MAG: hypothetical protein JF616_20920 [Fibrobacteres bacterium]|jgi:hypothetical protein|nr:hypothetical protein [Fibrobacterota bacterium]